MYKVQVLYFDQKIRRPVIARGLTEAEAQAICHSQEASWKTCTKPHLKARTRERGAWFLGYTNED